MAGKIKIKSDGRFHTTEITTESGETICCSDFKIRVIDRKLYAIITVPQPILDIETENYEVINESRNDSV